MIVNVLAAILLAAAATAEILGIVHGPEIKLPRAVYLIKTSETDSGKWMTDQEIFEDLISQRKGFFDITHIKDRETLKILSTPGNAAFEDAKDVIINYPKQAEHLSEGQAMMGKIDIERPKKWLSTFSNFTTRHFRSRTGSQASRWLYDQVNRIASKNKDIKVSQFTHSYNQPSIIARIRGKTPKLTIVGAHLDSTSGTAQSRSPGADDNGSGTVTLLEAFRVIVESGYKPIHTIEFHWYSGEEGGLLGSQDVFAKYKKEEKIVMAMLNQDMTGYSPSGRPAVYTDYTDEPLTQFVSTLIAAYTGQEPNNSSCGYGCSDHASARANGFAAAFVSEDEFDKSNPYIHTPEDSPEKIEWDTIHRHINITIAFVLEASQIPDDTL